VFFFFKTFMMLYLQKGKGKGKGISLDFCNGAKRTDYR